MTGNKTAEQVREEHLQALGPALGPLYHALHNEVIWLHAKWQQYRILFAESPDRVDLLNGVAGFFFRVIQDVLWKDVVLHIARLTDPSQSVGKANLTLTRLEGAVQDSTLSLEIRNLVAQAKTDAEFARVWRNRHLAHSDLALAVDERATPLPGVSREGMERVLASVRAVLNKIEEHCFSSEVAFSDLPAHADAESLAYYLKIAVNAEIRQRERLLQGHLLPEDFES
jgi:hypothetical protein